MAQEKNRLLRILVPVIAILAGIGVAAAVLLNSNRHQAPAPGAAAQPSGQAQQGAAPAQPGATPADGVATAPPPLPLTGLRARPAPAEDYRPIGEPLEPKDQRVRQTAFAHHLDFSPVGAGIRSLVLAEHFQTIREEQHEELQRQHTQVDADGRIVGLVTPLAALAVEINGTVVPLAGSPGSPLWRQTSVTEGAATFEAIIEDGQGAEVARVERTYILKPGSYSLELRQHLENLSGGTLRVRWYQYGPVDLPAETVAYGGETRRVKFGYLLPPNVDPSRTVLGTAYATQPRSQVLGQPDASGAYPALTVWPNEASTNGQFELVWLALSNRYFAVALHPLIDVAAPAVDKVFRLVQTVDRFVLPLNGTDQAVVLRVTGPVRDVPAGGEAEMNMGLYAGPLDERVIEADPLTRALGLTELIVYNLGGMCSFCTFAWLAHLLLDLLRGVHFLVRDWAISIILLVVIVRTILHPVTRWSQIRLQRFGKQMQDLAPKQKKLQERYKDDPQKLREETAKLWREEGVNPAGALGCLPMFLQSPVWFALFAMLFYAVELRHQPAFYGLFQAIQPQGSPFWWFLGDLAEPDRFWYFGRVLVNLPLLGAISSLNLLPIILGVVFFIQQKYLQPPTTTTLTPEQEQQQKIMKVMMVVMFPLFMYNAPSGLALYFIANSTLGILESKWIRAHITKHDLLTPPKRKPGAGGGFIQRLQAIAEAQQQAQARRQGGRPGPRK